MNNLGTPFVRLDGNGKYWDDDGFRVLRPVGTKWVRGLQVWCEAIPEELRCTLGVIGAYTGEGSLIQSRYFRRVIDIDPWEGVENIYQCYLRRTAQAQNIEHIRGYSTRVIPELPEGRYIFYIDGNHRRRAVEADIVTCIARSRNGDYIGGPGYVEGSGVQTAVDRYFKSVRVFEDYSWLAVVG